MTTGQSLVQRRPDGAALVIAGLLAALGALLIWQGFAIPDKGGYAGVGSGGMPKFVGLGLLALALAHVLKAVKGVGGSALRPLWGPVLWIMAGLIVQLALLYSLGFSIATGLLFALTAAGFGKRRWAISIPCGIALAFGVYAVFDRLLNLNLPAGFLETLVFGA